MQIDQSLLSDNEPDVDMAKVDTHKEDDEATPQGILIAVTNCITAV